jgi:circadian clock protein KaiC
MVNTVFSDPRLSTGISGLDNVLHGGLPMGHVYLIEGDPGAGKTTLGMQFLLQGIAHDEKVLFVTLAESKGELEKVAASHGFDISKIDLFEVSPPELAGRGAEQYTVFHPAEVELADVMQSILDRVEKSQAARIVIDSMSEIRMLARDPLRYRRQVLTLKQFFVGKKATVLLLDDRTGDRQDLQLQSISHGVIRLENLRRDYGVTRRQLEALKVRASQFREGVHDYVIRKGGLEVFPRLISSEHKARKLDMQNLESGLDELDKLFGGGVPTGSTTLLIGPAGVGKSTIASKFLDTAAARGQNGVLFSSDETLDSLLTRCRGLGIALETHIKNKTVHVSEMEAANMSPGEFIHHIRRQVEERQVKVVVVDSLNGLLNAMQEERMLMVHLHELLSYLNHKEVTTFMVLAQSGVIGNQMRSPIDVSYIADNVLLFRYFEAEGAVRQAVSVVKRRNGRHERTIRELRMSSNGIEIGEPLKQFQGVLTGVPTYIGDKKPLL